MVKFRAEAFWAALIACVVGSIIKWPLLIYPSVDDIRFIQSSLYGGEKLTMMTGYLEWGRIIPLVVFKAVRSVGIPEYVLGEMLYFPTELLYALLVVVSLRRLRPATSPVMLAVAALIAGFHPGYIELASFGAVRPGLAISLSAILAYMLYASPSRPFLFSLWTGFTCFVAMCSYQGSVNLFLICTVILVLAQYLNDLTCRFSDMGKACLWALVGLVTAVILDFLLLQLLARIYHTGGLFHLVSPAEMFARIIEMADRFPDNWDGLQLDHAQVIGGRLAMLLLLAGPILISLRADTAARRSAVAGTLLCVAVFAVSLQPLSIPFNYNWFPPRTAFWAYFGLLAIAFAWIGSSQLDRIRSRMWMASFIPAALIIVGQACSILSSYVTLRENDMAIAREIVGRLEEKKFDWRTKPVYVELGPWINPPMYWWKTGTPGDMMSLLRADWSRIPLLSMAAGTDLLSPPEGKKRAVEICGTQPPHPVRYGLVVTDALAVVCL